MIRYYGIHRRNDTVYAIVRGIDFPDGSRREYLDRGTIALTAEDAVRKHRELDERAEVIIHARRCVEYCRRVIIGKQIKLTPLRTIIDDLPQVAWVQQLNDIASDEGDTTSCALPQHDNNGPTR